MRQSRGRGSKVETEARPCEAEARPSQLKNCLEAASSRGRCLEDYIPVNRSLSSRVFPTQFKAAFIEAGSGPSEGKSYRTISNLTVLSKALERLRSSAISVSGSCCQNCSQHTELTTQPRLQCLEWLMTSSRHWIAVIWLLWRCSTYLQRSTWLTILYLSVAWRCLMISTPLF